MRFSKCAEQSCCDGNTHGHGRVADGVEQCLHAAREELGKESTSLRSRSLMASYRWPTYRLTNLQYMLEEIRALTKAASDSDAYVTAHPYMNDCTCSYQDDLGDVRQAALSSSRLRQDANMVGQIRYSTRRSGRIPLDDIFCLDRHESPVRLFILTGRGRLL